jgi:exodeoxyribonuclease VII small subunit
MKSFEDRLNRLESLSEKLREGKIPLEEAVSIFEEGMKLAKDLEKELAKIERKVEILVNEPEKKGGSGTDTEPILELFPEEADSEERR